MTDPNFDVSGGTVTWGLAYPCRPGVLQDIPERSLRQMQQIQRRLSSCTAANSFAVAVSRHAKWLLLWLHAVYTKVDKARCDDPL